MSKTSASGDRIDFGGKVPQFELFAHKIYVELTHRNLVWIKIGDPDAGNADDIQYATNTEIRAYQVKWSQQSQKPPFRYLEFLELFPRLRESWLNLKKANKDMEVPIYVHLLTNRIPSTHDQLSIDRPTNTKRLIGSFSDFLKHAWLIIHSGNKPDGDWGIFLDQVCKTLNLSQTDFLTFAQHLRLEFDVKLPQAIDHKYHEIYKNDTTKLYKFFHDTLAHPSGPVKFTADDLIKQMQWEGRIKTIFSHDFFIDPTIYQPNTSTINQLSEAIELLPGKYIFLEGSPGSGKSSLLTQWAIGRTEKVIKYFAFLNQSHGNQPIRGEAVNLYHDLSIQLTESGFFGSTIFGIQGNLTETQQVFQNQLQQVGDLYKAQNLKTIIIIDGLDHIPREYSKQGTLLEQLPNPNDIPDGVYIILGSQSFDLAGLPISVKQTINQSGRKIKVLPLFSSAVSLIADSVLDNPLTQAQHELLFLASEGHPLFLQYMLRALKNEDTSTSIEEILAHLPPFRGDIEDYYERIWQEFEADDDIADFLGLVSRLRFGFHLNMEPEWSISRAAALKLRRWFNQFFDDSYGYKTFFHNSFRQFLLRKTAESPLSGTYSYQTHLNYHARLANLSVTSSSRLFRHEHLYHVYHAEQFDRFHETLTPEYVDRQRHACRPFDLIREDLILGLQLAAESQDLQYMLRYGFLMGELHRREWNINQVHFLNYFPNLFNFESVVEYALLPINSSERRSRALEIARLLYQNNYEAEARRLFILAEPNAYIGTNLIIDTYKSHWQEQAKPLEAWVRIKCFWVDPIELLKKIVHVKIKEDSNEHDNQELQVRLLDALIQSLSDSPFHRPKLLNIFSSFDYSHENNINFFLPRLHKVITVCLQDGDTDLCESLMSIFLRDMKPTDFPIDKRIEIAQLLYNIGKYSKEYQNWVHNIDLKPLIEIPVDSISEGRLDYYLPYFWYITLQTINYKSINLLKLFPDVLGAKHYDPVVTEWFRMLARIAILRGEGLRGERFNGHNFLPIIRFYYRPEPHISKSTQYRMHMMRDTYYKHMVEAIATYGSDSLIKASVLFENEITQYPTYWSAESQINIWYAFHSCSLNKDRVKPFIDSIAEAVIAEQGDLDGRINVSLELSEKYLEIGETETAQFWLLRTMDESLGIGYRKDYQFNDWISWMRKANSIEPEKAQNRICQLVSYLDHVDRTTDGGGASGRAAYALLKACMDWNKVAAIELFEWMLKKKYITIDDGTELLIDKMLEGEITTSLLAGITDLFGKVLLFSSESLSKKTFSNLVRCLQKHNQNELLTELIEDIERYALPELRTDYHQLLRNESVSFSPVKGLPINKREQEHEGLPTVYLDNSRITQSEFIDQYETASELQKLLLKVHESSGYFNWPGCLGKVQHEIDESWIVDTVQAITNKRDDLFRLILALGELAYKKKYTKTAKAIASNLLSEKGDSWSPFYDGGRRLRAFEFAIKSEGEPALKAAWFDFVNQLERGSPIELFRELDEIIPVLAPEADIRLIWEEIETYLNRMFSQIKPTSDAPISDLLPIDPEFLIARLALKFCLVGERGLRESALGHVARMAAVSENYIVEIRRFVNEINTDIDLELFAKIALYLSRTNPLILSELPRELSKLSESSLFSSQVTAYELVQKHNLPNVSINRIRRQLVWLKPSVGKKGDESELHRLEKLLSNIWKNTQLTLKNLLDSLKWNLSELANSSRLDIVILLQQAITLLEDEWHQKSGRFRVLVQGGELGLESTFYPYAIIIPFLKDRLLNELWEGGKIPHWKQASWLNPIYDSVTLQFRQHRRPEKVPGLIGFEAYDWLPSNWVEKIDSGTRHFIEQIGDFTVVAEKNIFRGLGWELATEVRESCWAIREEKSSTNFSTGAFNRIVNLSVDDYIDISNGKNLINTSSLFIATYAEHWLNTPSYLGEWIALNPIFARQLGWRLVDPLRFRWVDKNNNMMIESFFWVDGNIRMSPPHLRSQSGSGWIVIASQEAIKALKNQFNLLHKYYLNRYRENPHKNQKLHYTKLVE
ncbi:hypothetical protein [Runella limosa]|uniref:hypothetical protein n=1 Tax=Runella limosa TaxID=370978 RepID=UPI0004208CFF|nr:hypothetical protein [Runella limosa]